MERYVFYECEALQNLYYFGTEAEWSKVFYFGDEYIDGAKLYFYSNEKPMEEGNFWHYVNGEVVEW